MPKNENKKNETCILADCHLTIVMITFDFSRLEYIRIGVSKNDADKKYLAYIKS